MKQVFGEKTGVFEKEQQSQIEANPEAQEYFPCHGVVVRVAFDQAAEGIVCGNRTDDDCREPAFADEIEKQTEKHICGIAPRNKKLNQKKCRQEQEEEIDTRKNHASSFRQ